MLLIRGNLHSIKLHNPHDSLPQPYIKCTSNAKLLRIHIKPKKLQPNGKEYYVFQFCPDVFCSDLNLFAP
jgi:hypothetical protein